MKETVIGLKIQNKPVRKMAKIPKRKEYKHFSTN